MRFRCFCAFHSPSSCGGRATAETETEAEMRREIEIRRRGSSSRPGEAARGKSVVQFVRLSLSCSGHRSQRQDTQNGSAVECFKMGKKMKTETRTNNVESRQSTCNRILCKIVFALWLRLALKPVECTHTRIPLSALLSLAVRARRPSRSTAVAGSVIGSHEVRMCSALIGRGRSEGTEKKINKHILNCTRNDFSIWPPECVISI